MRSTARRSRAINGQGELNTARIKLAGLSWARAWVDNHGYQATVNASALASSTRPFPALFARYNAASARAITSVSESLESHSSIPALELQHGAPSRAELTPLTEDNIVSTSLAA